MRIYVANCSMLVCLRVLHRAETLSLLTQYVGCVAVVDYAHTMSIPACPMKSRLGISVASSLGDRATAISAQCRVLSSIVERVTSICAWCRFMQTGQLRFRSCLGLVDSCSGSAISLERYYVCTVQHLVTSHKLRDTSVFEVMRVPL